MKSFNCWIFLCKSASFQKELLKSTHFGYNNKSIPDLHLCINEEQTNSIEEKSPSSRHIPNAFNSLFPQQNSSFNTFPSLATLDYFARHRRITEDLGEINYLHRNEDLLLKHFLLWLFSTFPRFWSSSFKSLMLSCFVARRWLDYS